MRTFLAALVLVGCHAPIPIEADPSPVASSQMAEAPPKPAGPTPSSTSSACAVGQHFGQTGCFDFDPCGRIPPFTGMPMCGNLSPQNNGDVVDVNGALAYATCPATCPPSAPVCGGQLFGFPVGPTGSTTLYNFPNLCLPACPPGKATWKLPGIGPNVVCGQ
jgi:hypothetical protein